MHLPTSNAEFLSAIFGTLTPDALPFVTGFPGHPKDKSNKARNWNGWPWTPGAVCDAPGFNWYLTLATYRPGSDGSYRRKVEQFVALHGLMLDDIGTDTPLSRLDALPPSILVQTSDGNFQATYLFAEPLTDKAAADALQASFFAAGIGDPDADGPAARNGRLPFGVNGKHSPPHQCRLVEWHPERRYSVDEIVRGLALPAPIPKPPVAYVAAASAEWEAKTPAEQAATLGDLRSALAAIPSDVRKVWVSVGHYLRTLPDCEAFILFDEWSRKSERFDEGGLLQFWTFNADRSSYKRVFKLAEEHGWENPRRHVAPVAAEVFREPCELPPRVTTTPPAQTTPERRFELMPEDPLQGARALIQRRFAHPEGSCLKFWQGSFYRWTASHWVEMTEADARALLYAFLDENGASHYRPNQSKVSNLLDALKHAPGVHIDSTHAAAPCWLGGHEIAPAAELVACSNGLLHLPTRRISTPTPRFFNMNATPFAYDPHAPAPTHWLQFLAEVWPDDPEAIATLQELFGYLLTPDTRQQKIFMIVGPKRSGKGTIARVLAEMLGSANVAGPTLDSMTAEFGLQPLLGKLAAIISDARLSGRADQKTVAESLLRISGEDRIDVNRKHKDSITIKLGVRFVMTTNELPRIADASGAMASRFVIVTMRQSFFGREDPGLTSKLLGELPGILAWAVEGWHRLNARGHFIEPRSSAGAAQELADLGSPIGAFLREECTCAPHAEVEVSKLFLAWQTWCAGMNIQRPGTVQDFGRDLKAACASITRTQPRINGVRVPFYRGVALTGTRWHAIHSIVVPAAPVPAQ